MIETPNQLTQPLAYRVWDSDYASYFYTDVRPETGEQLDRWTGLFDRQGAPVYENDILRMHYDWRLGWVRALVVRDASRGGYMAEATAPDGKVLRIGFYSFADAYRVGNIREHPGKLVTAKEQFAEQESSAWWLSPAIFRSRQGTCAN